MRRRTSTRRWSFSSRSIEAWTWATRELSELEPGLWSSLSLPEVTVAAGGEVLAFGPSSPGGIAVATIGILVVLTVLGLGYARASFDDRAVVLGTAPAFGAASLSLVALLLDRLGLRLQEVPVALAASALAGLGGLAVFVVVQRQRFPRAPSGSRPSQTSSPITIGVRT